MELAYTYWRDGEFYVGYLDMWPDHSTQGYSLEELEEALNAKKGAITVSRVVA